mgnify:CR=1 FL=1
MPSSTAAFSPWFSRVQRSEFRMNILSCFVLVLGFRNLGFLVDLDFDVSSDREAMRRNNTVPVNEERCGVAC